ncbi:MAG: amidohydrolase family protein [Acidobacteriaceae bacterium]|nr:amidohydrolase family protein [Acidobacteriaceae bacterium]
MKNPKTAPSPPKPQPQSGWVRKCELDQYLDRNLPVPTQVVSNEEFIPIPQTAKQAAVEHRLLETADHAAKKLGIDRRSFLRTTCGMAAAYAVMNSVFGNFFTVEAAELFDRAAVDANKPDYFIFDVQTHHVAVGRHMIGPLDILQARRENAALNPALGKHEQSITDLYLENYIKEVFLDSDTAVACVSGVPDLEESKEILPPDQMVRSRNLVNQLTGSQRMKSHGLFSPDLGTRNLEDMHRQAEVLKIDAWKGYTGQGLGANKEGWWVDDEKIAYPSLELSRKLGVKNICLHKGLAIGVFNEGHCHPKDIVKVSRDFPDLNFLVYHSGLKTVEDALPAAEDGFRKNAYVPWVSDLCTYREQNPHMTNVYMELGTSFGSMVVTHPMLAAHVLGMIIKAFGPDHVLWGTDSIWWGSPQWQIEAMRRLEMPEVLSKRFGYAPLTRDVKAKIFGLNAAKLYNVDPNAKRNPVPGDYVERIRKQYKESGAALPSNTQYGWVRA